MANKRMFSSEIVASDAFLDMPVSSQNLYFHLGMSADDDGFIQPKKVMRLVGAGDDDLKLLFAKRFLLPINEVTLIKHWRMNNNKIDADRYKPSVYRELVPDLRVKENKAYTLDKTQGLPVWAQVVHISGTQSRVEQSRVEQSRTLPDAKASVKVIKPKPPKKETTHNPRGAEIIKALERVDPKNKMFYNRPDQRKSCDFLIQEYGLEQTLNAIEFYIKATEARLKYLPVITNPSQLVDKWQNLKMLVGRKMNEVADGDQRMSEALN